MDEHVAQKAPAFVSTERVVDERRFERNGTVGSDAAQVDAVVDEDTQFDGAQEGHQQRRRAARVALVGVLQLRQDHLRPLAPRHHGERRRLQQAVEGRLHGSEFVRTHQVHEFYENPKIRVAFMVVLVVDNAPCNP